MCDARQQSNADADKSPTAQEAISYEVAVRNLVNRVEPVYPALAKAARIQGVVRFQVVITETGDVADLRLVSGHPLLIQAAKDAVRQWRFKPFVRNGKVISVTAAIEVPFSMGISAEGTKQEESLNSEFFKTWDECRTEYKNQQYLQAEHSCEAGLKLVDQLPPERRMGRVSAYGLSGQVLLAEHKFEEAAARFKQ
jgi:TonB family protein